MKTAALLLIAGSLATTAQASQYKCDLAIREKVPSKIVLQQKTGHTIRDEFGQLVDEYKDINETQLNQTPNCKVGEYGYDYKGDLRSVMESCSFDHVAQTVTFTTDGTDCVNLPSGHKSCTLGVFSPTTFDLADKTLGEGSHLFVIVSGRIDKDPASESKSVIGFVIDLERELKAGQESSSALTNNSVPADVAFFTTNQLLAVPSRTFPTSVEGLRAQFGPQLSARFSCVRQ